MNVLPADKILQALFAMDVLATEDTVFTQGAIADQLGVSNTVWEEVYRPIFDGMLRDREASAPDSGARYREAIEQVDRGRYRLTAYGRELIAGLNETRRSPSETIELPRVNIAPDESLDGLRSWQAAVVRLWSSGVDSFAELSIGWYPPDGADGPWIARLYCGDRASEGWVEDVQVIRAQSFPVVLQRLWDRAKARHGLFKDDPRLPLKTPGDFPADLWLTIAERALLDRLLRTLGTHMPKTAARFTYHPDNRPNTRWVMALHPFNLEPPQGVLYDAAGPTFMVALNSLIERLEARLKAGDTEQVAPEVRALMERKTDIGFDQETRIIRGGRQLGDGNPESTAVGAAGEGKPESELDDNAETDESTPDTPAGSRRKP